MTAPPLETGRLILPAPAMADGPAFRVLAPDDRFAWRGFARAAMMRVLKGLGAFWLHHRATGQTIGMAGRMILPAERQEPQVGRTIRFPGASDMGYSAFVAATGERRIGNLGKGEQRSITEAKRLGCTSGPKASLRASNRSGSVFGPAFPGAAA